METIQAFAANIDKINAEVSKYEPLPVVWDRVELHGRKKLWINTFKMAAQFLRQKYGENACDMDPLPPAIIAYLRSDEDIGEIPAYVRCVFSKEDLIVMHRHGAEAYGALMECDMPGFRDFLKFQGWILNIETAP